MNPLIPLIIKVATGAILLGLWVWLTISPQPNSEALMSFIQLTLGGLVGHLTTQQPKGIS